MSTSFYENNFTKISDTITDKRVSTILTAVLFSLFVHICLGWYGLHAIKTAKIQVPRRTLEFKIVKPEPIITPPKPLPISPIPHVIPSPEKPKVVKPLPPPPAPTPPKAEQIRESVKPAEVQEHKTAVTELPPIFPQSEDAASYQVNSDVEDLPVGPSVSGESNNYYSSDVASSASANMAHGSGPPVTGPIFDADYLNNPTPPYPAAARRLKLQGTVVVRVLVNPQGKPEIIQLAKSSGASVLDGAALKAVKDWSFVPAQEGNTPVSAWVDVPIRFRLN